MKVQVERFGRTVDVELVIAEPGRFSYRLEDLPTFRPRRAVSAAAG